MGGLKRQVKLKIYTQGFQGSPEVNLNLGIIGIGVVRATSLFQFPVGATLFVGSVGIPRDVGAAFLSLLPRFHIRERFPTACLRLSVAKEEF